MENSINQEQPENKYLLLDETGMGHLKELRSWTNFLSIVGFVVLGLMIIFGLALPSAMTQSMPYQGVYETTVIIMMLLFVVLYFFPIYYLFTFSRLSKQAIETGDSAIYNEAMRFLKKHYRFMGILTIVVLSIYIIIILVAAIAGSLFSMFNM